MRCVGLYTIINVMKVDKYVIINPYRKLSHKCPKYMYVKTYISMHVEFIYTYVHVIIYLLWKLVQCICTFKYMNINEYYRNMNET
jgi:hypothetical protein